MHCPCKVHVHVAMPVLQVAARQGAGAMQMLGLDVDKYVEGDALAQPQCSWQAALSSEACDRLAALWAEAMREPLCASAARSSTSGAAAADDIFRPPLTGEPLAAVAHTASQHCVTTLRHKPGRVCDDGAVGTLSRHSARTLAAA